MALRRMAGRGTAAGKDRDEIADETGVDEMEAALAGGGSHGRTVYGMGTGAHYAPLPSYGLTVEQEGILLEHLPIVRFLARRIHERLPQHVDMEDLV